MRLACTTGRQACRREPGSERDSGPTQALGILTIVAVVAQRDNQPPWRSTDEISTCRSVCPALSRLGYAPSTLHGVLPGIRTQNLLICHQDTYALSVSKVCHHATCLTQHGMLAAVPSLAFVCLTIHICLAEARNDVLSTHMIFVLKGQLQRPVSSSSELFARPYLSYVFYPGAKTR